MVKCTLETKYGYKAQAVAFSVRVYVSCVYRKYLMWKQKFSIYVDNSIDYIG